MGRQDAQRCIEHQSLAPWDADTAPPTPRKLHTETLRAALVRWERDRGLSVSLRDQIEGGTREALARRKLLCDDPRNSEED